MLFVCRWWWWWMSDFGFLDLFLNQWNYLFEVIFICLCRCEYFLCLSFSFVCVFLSCPVLCLVVLSFSLSFSLSCPVLSCLLLSSLVLSCLVLSCLVLSCLVLSVSSCLCCIVLCCVVCLVLYCLSCLLYFCLQGRRYKAGVNGKGEGRRALEWVQNATEPQKIPCLCPYLCLWLWICFCLCLRLAVCHVLVIFSQSLHSVSFYFLGSQGSSLQGSRKAHIHDISRYGQIPFLYTRRRQRDEKIKTRNNSTKGRQDRIRQGRLRWE